MNDSFGLNTLLILGAIVNVIALGGLLWRKNLLMMLLCLELMVVGLVVAFVGAARYHSIAGQAVGEGAMMVFFMLVIAACEVALGVSLIFQLYKQKGTFWVDDITEND